MTEDATAIFRRLASPATQVASDETLAHKAAQDPSAFADLYRRHVNGLYRYLAARVTNPQDVQDLTAQVFLTALESIHRYQERGSFSAWLFGIARHKVADYYRQHGETVPLEMAFELPHPDPLPDEVVAKRLRLEAVANALQVLSPERADALALRLFGGLNAAEVGQVMDKSEAAVRMLIYRATHDLRMRLAPASEYKE